MNTLYLKYYGLLAAANITLLTAAPGVPIQYAQLPALVQKGLTVQLGNGKLGDIDRDEEDGEVTFTFEGTKAGRTIDYTLDETGALISVEVALGETPLAVQKTVRNQVGQGTLESIDKSFEDGKVSYEFEWKTKDGAEKAATVLEDGKLDSIQVELAETPAAVQATIAKEAAGGQVQEIYKTFDDKAVFYDVTINRGGVNRDIEVAENGRVESRQVFPSEIPPAVQNTIQQSIGSGKLRSINQVFEKKKGGSDFEVEAVKDGKSISFTVGPKGAFLGMEN
jgi:hypothetical protein